MAQPMMWPMTMAARALGHAQRRKGGAGEDLRQGDACAEPDETVLEGGGLFHTCAPAFTYPQAVRHVPEGCLIAGAGRKDLLQIAELLLGIVLGQPLQHILQDHVVACVAGE